LTSPVPSQNVQSSTPCPLQNVQVVSPVPLHSVQLVSPVPSQNIQSVQPRPSQNEQPSVHKGQSALPSVQRAQSKTPLMHTAQSAFPASQIAQSASPFWQNMQSVFPVPPQTVQALAAGNRAPPNNRANPRIAAITTTTTTPMTIFVRGFVPAFSFNESHPLSFNASVLNQFTVQKVLLPFSCNFIYNSESDKRTIIVRALSLGSNLKSTGLRTVKSHCSY